MCYYSKFVSHVSVCLLVGEIVGALEQNAGTDVALKQWLKAPVLQRIKGGFAAHRPLDAPPKFWANVRVCRRKCGDDESCQKHCLEMLDIGEDKCHELEKRRTCHKTCADDLRCHETCRTSHRGSQILQACTECHLRCSAGEGGRECHRRCSTCIVSLHRTCVASATARLCEKHCHEEHSCQKLCRQKALGAGLDSHDYHHKHGAAVHHAHSHHHTDHHHQHDFESDDNGDAVMDRRDSDHHQHDSLWIRNTDMDENQHHGHPHGHHHGVSRSVHHLKERLVQGCRVFGQWWHAVLTTAHHELIRTWHHVSHNVVGLWHHAQRRLSRHHGWRRHEHASEMPQKQLRFRTDRSHVFV